MQGNEGDFGWAVDTYGGSTANALVHIEGLGGRVVAGLGIVRTTLGGGWGVVVGTLGEAVRILNGMVVPAGGFMEHKVGERVPEESYLSGVGVPAEG